ncbi:MAG: GGDEF domain-containing protein [Legionellaceae bacterium]|nr:GGDEF domain-containing protein [Legionellaceae bacterium]
MTFNALFINNLVHHLDIAGFFILIYSLGPIAKLIYELPTGKVKKQWKILIAFIIFFIISYAYISAGYHIKQLSFNREAICLVLFFGATFVAIVSHLSLKTARNLKRISLLEIENITDPLMGIYNKRWLEQKLVDEFSKAKRYGVPLSALIMDIDKFKNINDTYGHEVGDMALSNLGHLIRTSIREQDFPVRFGGDEVLIIFPLTTAKNAMIMAERLRKSVQKAMLVPQNINTDTPAIYVTISAGVAQLTKNMRSEKELLKHADHAMYQAKNNGHNRVSLYVE